MNILKFLPITALSLLCACGGGDPAPVAMRAAPEVKAVAMADVPALSVCLDRVAAALTKDPLQREVGLECASGAYKGLTADGRSCSLHVDGIQGLFEFMVDHDTVDIRLQTVALSASGKPIHNLEDASSPLQPGVQLTRFSGGLSPVTEALVLRMGSGIPVLPKMIYQRMESNSTKIVECSFGA